MGNVSGHFGTPQHYVLDFTHVYDDEHLKDRKRFRWIDCSDIEGSNLYCSPQAERQVSSRISPYGIHGIHFVDSGNYHYVTKIITDQIRQPFSLAMFDHHTDMQPPMLGGMMSCGDWAGLVLDQNKYLQQFILIGPLAEDLSQIHTRHPEKLLTFSAEEIRRGEGRDKLALIRKDVPWYLSIDKDVLGEKYSETNWNQGEMSLGMMEHMLKFFVEQAPVYGVDICGECSADMDLPEYLQAEEINGRTNEELFRYLGRYVLG